MRPRDAGCALILNVMNQGGSTMIGIHQRSFSSRASLAIAAVLFWAVACMLPLRADPPPGADLSFAKGCGPLVSPAGQPLNCSASVTNRGPGRARNVNIVDYVPGNVIRSSLPPMCNMGPFNILRCRMGDLDAGDSASIRFLVTSPMTGILKNTGTAVAPIFDSDYRNNSDQAFFARQVVSSSPFVGANLSISSAVLESDFFPQNQVFFQHTVTNEGPDAALGAGLISTLTTFQSNFRVTAVSSSSSTATCNLHNSRPFFSMLPTPTPLLDRVNAVCSIGDLEPGASVQFIFGIQPQQPESQMIFGGAGVFSNSADVSLANNETLFSFPQCRPIGDANGDGLVDSTDLNIVNSHLGKVVSADDPASAAADVDGDGRVDENDAQVVIINTTNQADVNPYQILENPKYGSASNIAGKIRDLIGTVIGERSGIKREDLMNAFGVVQADRILTSNAPPGTTTGIGFTNFYSNVQNNDTSTVYLTTGAGTCVAVIIYITDQQGLIQEIRIIHIDATNDPKATIEAAGPFPIGTRAIVFGGDNNYEDSRVTMKGTKEALEAAIGQSNIDYFTGDSLGIDGQGNLYTKQPGVQRAETTTSLSSSPNPSVPGQSVTFSVNVTSSDGTPTGTVTLSDGNTVLGTVTLDSNGQASFTTSNLTAGSHPISAAYSGDDNFGPSFSLPLSQVVNPASSPTTTDLTSSLNPSTSGQSVTFTASVSSPGGTPTGNVTFRDGTTVLGTGTLDSAGQASFTTSNLTTGSHSITAEYGGDSNFDPSTSPPLSQAVSPASTSTDITSSVNPSSLGQSVVLTAMVTSAGGTPTQGGITFLDGATIIGTATLDSLGQASIDTSSLTVGSHNLTAAYGGDSDFAGSTSPVLTQTVNKADPTIDIETSSNPSSFGQSVTFSGTLSGRSGTPTPTGTVTFLDGANVIGTGTLDGNGQVFLTLSTLSVGSHPITMSYGGDTNFNPRNVGLTQIVNRADTAITLSSSPNPSNFNQVVIFTATITSTGGTPTGALTIFDGATPIGTVPLSNGQASFSRSTLAVGTHNITVEYSGNANFNGSTSNVVTQIVNP